MRLSKLALLLILPTVVFTVPAVSKEDLAKREAELLAQVRASKYAGPPVELAEVRERRGRYPQALATWGLIKKSWAKRQVTNESSAPNYTYGEWADFVTQRLHRKRKLAAARPRFNVQVQQRTSDWLNHNKLFFLQEEGNYDFLVQADLDGDFIDELFFVGKYGSLGKRNKPFMGIAKWDGSRYRVVYRATGKNKPIIMPAAYAVVDEDGDGWKEVNLSFEPETDNGATLYFNGKTAMMLW